MLVTDEMVETALGILFPLNAAFNEGAHERLKAKIRSALEAALSHAAGQDGEQCRAASGLSDADIEFMANEMAGRLGEDSGYMEDMLRGLLRALSRGVPEDTKRMDWLVANVTETLTAKSIQGEFPHPEHKTQYVLPRLIAWADFHGQVGFREAIDYAIAAQRKEG